MFIDFFYKLRNAGLPVSPTAFLTLHRAMATGLVGSLEDFYTASRTILIKSERYFDLYDQIFAHHFKGVTLMDPEEVELKEVARTLLEEWLKNPAQIAAALGIDEKQLKKMTTEELLQYFMDRLKDQTEEHHGGNKWIGGRPVNHEISTSLHPSACSARRAGREKPNQIR